MNKWVQEIKGSTLPPESMITHKPLLTLHSKQALGLCVVYPDHVTLPELLSYPLNKIARRFPVLLFTESELKRTADCYPIELLEMVRTETVLIGRSIRPLIQVEPAALRLEIEANCRRNLILLRQQAWSNPLALPGILRASLGQLLQTIKYVPVLNAAIVLPIENAELDQISKALDLDLNPLDSLSLSIIKPHAPNTWRKIAEQYLDLLTLIVSKIDTFDIQ
jgi:hypothetical protein